MAAPPPVQVREVQEDLVATAFPIFTNKGRAITLKQTNPQSGVGVIHDDGFCGGVRQ